MKTLVLHNTSYGTCKLEIESHIGEYYISAGFSETLDRELTSYEVSQLDQEYATELYNLMTDYLHTGDN
jgi:hypothetical protein